MSTELRFTPKEITLEFARPNGHSGFASGSLDADGMFHVSMEWRAPYNNYIIREPRHHWQMFIENGKISYLPYSGANAPIRSAENTVTENPDGSYTVINYPDFYGGA